MNVNLFYLGSGLGGVTAEVNLRSQEVTIVIFSLHFSDIHLLIVLRNTKKTHIESN